MDLCGQPEDCQGCGLCAEDEDVDIEESDILRQIRQALGVGDKTVASELPGEVKRLKSDLMDAVTKSERYQYAAEQKRRLRKKIHEALGDDEAMDADEPLRVGLDTIRGMQDKIRSLQDKLRDWEDSAKTAWKSPCDDEIHCGCVPLLRAKLDRIEAIVTTEHESKESFIARVRAVLG